MLGSSRSGCFGVARSWMILCVFCGRLLSVRPRGGDRRGSYPWWRRQIRLIGGSLRGALTVGLEAVLTAEEGPLDPEPDASDDENGSSRAIRGRQTCCTSDIRGGTGGGRSGSLRTGREQRLHSSWWRRDKFLGNCRGRRTRIGKRGCA